MRRLAAPGILALAVSFAVAFAAPARASSALPLTIGTYGWIVPATVSVVTWTCRFIEFADWVGDRIAADTQRARQRGEGRAKVAPEVAPDAPPADSTPPSVRRPGRVGARGTAGAHAIALPDAPVLCYATAAWDPDYEPSWHQILEQMWQRFRRFVQDLIDWLPGGDDAPGTAPPDPVIDVTPAPASLT